MNGYRESFAPAQVSFPATVLHDALVARWVRARRLTVDVRSVAELHSAISVGIHPVLMTVHADELDGGGLRRASAAGVGRVVLSRPEQTRALRANHIHHVLLRMPDAATDYSDHTANAVLSCRSAALIGLLCEVGGADRCPATIGNMIAQMDQIRRRHNVVLTRLVLCVDGGVAAEEIEESIDDACATMRFPRPSIAMVA